MKIKLTLKLVLPLFVFCFLTTQVSAQQRVKKVVLQAFWWDYWNNNFRFKWADYLTELAPRLKAMGVDAIWVPPNLKNDGPGSVGYSPFDHYDLGDKNQKGETASDTVRTRSGNKDELLRMIAVMHANGIEVIQDIVLNHQAGAGNRGGGGGRDYTAASAPYNDFASNYYKNFRYVCYATPHLDTSAADYWTRKGRWSNNLHNFYPNQNNNSVNTNNINTAYFGPDLAYETNSIGLSTNIPTSGSVTINGITKPYYNPVQSSNYMAQSAKDWIVWYKKQTGADGFRWDAVKHFGYDLQNDLTYALKYQSSFANGGNSMFNVGEYVGQASEIDYYANQLIKSGTPLESGVTNEQMSGGFDFGLRGYSSGGGIYSMVLGGGGFNMQSIPGCQQSIRYFDYPNGTRVYKTVPFVNSHDTYRPVLTANGNYQAALGDNSGWNTGSELGGNGQHIDPREPRFAAANAVISAVDGNPCFYIEDVFDYFSLGKRWTHLPSNADSLPLRKDVVNIMQCHQSLKFKDGNYGVPTSITGTNAPVYAYGSSGDHLVIERSGKAIIGISDAYSSISNNTQDQQVWVSVNSAWDTGIILYDYSGAHGIVGTKIYSDRRVLIKTAPCGHSISGAYGHGYSIWAPYSGTPTSVQDLYNYIASAYTQPRATTTTQEWEMADDLGDSHCASLGQGGQLPANNTNQRVAGKIFVQSGTTVNFKLFPAIDNTNINISLWDLDGNKLSEASGNSTAVSPISGSYSAAYTGWITVKVRNANTSQPAQKVWANVTYTAPATVNTRLAANAAKTRVCIWTSNKNTNDITDCGNWEEGLIPDASSTIVVPDYVMIQPLFPNSIIGRVIAPTNIAGNYTNVKKAVIKMGGSITKSINSDANGIYTATSLLVAPAGKVNIKPFKNNDSIKNSGVTAFDIILTQSHILGKATFTDPYKIIAADVTGDNKVTNFDIIYIKRLILGLDTTYPVKRLWSFVDSSYQIPIPSNPFPYKDSISIDNFSIFSNQANQTFIGLKLGDVNFDWKAFAAREIKTKPLELQYSVANDKLLKITLSTNNFKQLLGLQYTLHFDNEKYEFVSIDDNKLNIDFNSTEANATGNISMLWADDKAEPKTLDNGTELFTMVLKPKPTHSRLAHDFQLTLTSDITGIEAWDNDEQKHSIIISKKQSSVISPANQLAIYPNPSKGEVNIEMSDAKQLVVTDYLGRTIKQYSNIKSSVLKLQLNKGVYFVKAVYKDEEKISKVVVD